MCVGVYMCGVVEIVCVCVHVYTWVGVVENERECVCALFVVVVVIAGGFVLKFVVRSIVYLFIFSGRKNIIYPQRLGTAMCSLRHLGTRSGRFCEM